MARNPVKTLNKREYDVLLDLLRTARERAGLTQHGLSKALDEDPMYIHKVENKDRRLDLLEFVELCRALRMDPRDVLEDWLRAVEKERR